MQRDYERCVAVWSQFLIEREERYPNYGHLYFLQKNLCDNKHNKLKDILGPDHDDYNRLNELSTTIDFTFFNKFNELVSNGKNDDFDWYHLYTEIEAWLKIIDLNHSIVDQQIEIIENKISEIKLKHKEKYEVLQSSIEEINREVNDLNDYSLTSDIHVYHLYNDGEIVSQKGGDLYLERSIFQMRPPLMIPLDWFTFPIKCNGEYSYAIVDRKTADNIRIKIEKLLL